MDKVESPVRDGPREREKYKFINIYGKEAMKE